jgi:catechol 2,3-dioxygenase
MDGARLPDDARIGLVRLRVADLDVAVSFYERVLGLRSFSRGAGEALLSAGGEPPAALALLGDPRAPRRPARTTGLFHVAWLVPTRRDLARALVHLDEAGWPLDGVADHAVSESLYLADPEGNGIEVYADRPRAAWRRDGAELWITTEPLDLAGLAAEAGAPEPWRGLASGTAVGHVHLEVADLDAAEAFYAGALGFEVTARRYAGARFLAAGGYHHHLAVNVWARARARPAAGACGLVDFEVRVPSREARDRAAERLAAHGARPERAGEEGAFRVEDPAGIAVVVGG